MRAWIKVIAFLLCLALAIALVNQTLMFKGVRGTRQMAEFYQLEPDTIDVLMVGSSHLFMAVNPAKLWENEGITSYIMGGALQTMWEAYYALEEGLKHQKPKVIVLEALASTFTMEYNNYERYTENLVGFRLSATKLAAIRDCVPPEYRADILLGLPTYHSRYSKLTALDTNWLIGKKTVFANGYVPTYECTPYEAPDMSAVTGRLELQAKSREFLLRIADLAKKNDIPLLVMVSPFELTAEQQQKFNTVSDLATEKGFDFLNYNLFASDGLLDYSSDFNDVQHLNATGGAKLTAHLGRYLAERYALPNRQQEPAYQGWHGWAQAVAVFIQEGQVFW